MRRWLLALGYLMTGLLVVNAVQYFRLWINSGPPGPGGLANTYYVVVFPPPWLVVLFPALILSATLWVQYNKLLIFPAVPTDQTNTCIRHYD